MSRKLFAQVSVLVLILLALFGTPLGAQAGGTCGGTYIAEKGDTVEKIAAICGTSAAAIYAANPGISNTLVAGQSLTVPGSNYISPTTTSTPNSYPTVNYSGAYIVQYGDTFSGIASRFGVSVYNLWTVNPNISDINLLYIGQTINIPASTVTVVTPAPTETPTALSYGSVPANAPHGNIVLSNKANGDVYISLHGTTPDGINFIREYPVGGSMKVKVPAGWYNYVAWVGGKQFAGGFHLGGGSDHSITFYSNKVVVE